ncbi:hypothetical protein TNCT_637491 [Trichonephila clavata]|uniref:Uncharacterized protein n=1 Tax=Trichonephila clavata TaxID=2740835 RepID=A0A8X6HKE8_TRICU|nr:hypothetical protein TNCT_637491 [Trichonephila clavata]
MSHYICVVQRTFYYPRFPNSIPYLQQVRRPYSKTNKDSDDPLLYPLISTNGRKLTTYPDSNRKTYFPKLEFPNLHQTTQ